MGDQYDNYNEERRSTQRRSDGASQRYASRGRVNVGRVDSASRSGYADGRTGYASDRTGYSYYSDNPSGYASSRSGTSANRSGYASGRSGYTSERSGYSAERSGYASDRSGYTANRSDRSASRSGYSYGYSSYQSQRGGTARTRTTRSSADARRTSYATSRSASSSRLPNGIEPRKIIVIGIIAVVVIALLVGLVSCIAGAIGGSDDKSASSSAASQVVEFSGSSASASASSAAATLASNEGVEDRWVAGGRFTTGDAELDQLIKDHCDNWTSADLSQADNAFNAYCNAIWADYVERDNNQHPTGPNWDVEYAKQFFHEGSCNCYEQVAVGEFILKYFGYTDVYGEPCNVLRQSGSYGEHGILFVTDLDGRKCLCDPSFGANGWMLDADSYTMEIVDVGQDPAEFKIANFERVAKAPWLDA